MIALINLGNSNVQSVINTLDFLDAPYFITNDYMELQEASKIILPGVGSFGDGMAMLSRLNMINTLKEQVLVYKKPFLGICLGMQLLFEFSDESPGAAGLGFLSGSIVRLPQSSEYSIPRIGWADSRVNFDFLGFHEGEVLDFYYLHSFCVKPKDYNIVAIETEKNIVSAIQYKNMCGCQFHPEKSHKNGLKILKTFASC